MKVVGELVTGRAVVAINEGATVLEAAECMRDKRIGALMVVDEARAPVGIFTERDMMLRVVVEGRDAAKERVGDHMTREVFWVSPERTVSDAAHELQSRHIRHLPVVQNGEVIALLSARDLLREMLSIKREEVQALKAYIQGDEAMLSDDDESAAS